MEKHILGAVIAVPLLLVSGNLAGGGCNYTKPALVFEKACLDDVCRAHVRKTLPGCERSMKSEFITSVRHSGGIAKAPRLTLGTIDKLSECMSRTGFGKFNDSSLDLSAFREVTKEVRAAKAERVGGACSGANCSGVYMRPVVGETTFLFGPA